MNLLTLALVSLLSLSTLCFNTSASVLSQYGTNTLTGAGSVFTYNFIQFDSSLGTLNSVTFSIESSVDSGSFSVLNNTNTSIKVKSTRDDLVVVDNQGSGADYDSGNVTLVTTPSTAGLNGYTLAGNQGTNFTVTSKSLIGVSPWSTNISSSYFGAYTGTGSVTFGANISPNVTITGGTATIDMRGVTNPTVLSVVYDYTAAPPVPEPSTYALTLAGLAVIALVMTRRTKSA